MTDRELMLEWARASLLVKTADADWHAIARAIIAETERVRVLEAALAEAISDISAWGSYADGDTQDKHGLAECIARHRATLVSKEQP